MSVVIVLALIQSGQGQITVGGFVVFVTMMLMLLTPLKSLAEVNGPLQRGMAAAEAVFDLIDAPVERSGGRILGTRVHGRVDLVDVGFRYPGQKRRR